MTKQHGKDAKNTSDKQQSSRREYGNQKEYQRCGLSHTPCNCPAYNRLCAIYKLRGHFAKKCRNNNRISVVEKSEQTDPASEKVLFCGEVNVERKNNRDWFTKIYINRSKKVLMKMDSGAQCNVLPWEKYKMWKIDAPIEKTSTILSNYSGSKIEVIGKCRINCITQKGYNKEFKFSCSRV